MPPTISNTVEDALAIAGFNSGNWVPEHEPYPHIITQNRFGFIAMFGNQDVDPRAKFDKTSMKTVPALVRSVPSSSMNPKIDQYLTYPTRFTANGAVTSWDTTTAQNVTLDDTGGLQAYDILRDVNTSSEKIVISVTSSTVVSCKAFGGGTSGNGTEDIANNAVFEKTGSAWIDGATIGDGLRSAPQADDNYMQFMIDPYGIGMVEKELKKYPGENNQFDTRRELTRVDHNRKRELRALFGSKKANAAVDTSGTIYAAAGLTGLSSRTLNAGGAITLDEWNDAIMPEITRYGSGDYRALCGGRVLATWDKLARDQVRIGPKEEMYGNKVRKVQTTVEVITLHGTEPMNDRNGEMLMFIPQLIERKYFPKLNSVHIENIHARNTAKYVNGYFTVECIQARNKDTIVTVEGVLA